MKTLKSLTLAAALGTFLGLSSCGTINDKDNTSEGSGSASETTPNDSSGAESRAALGTDEGSQKDSLGYPSNQSNLNADSTSKKHDN